MKPKPKPKPKKTKGRDPAPPEREPAAPDSEAAPSVEIVDAGDADVDLDEAEEPVSEAEPGADEDDVGVPESDLIEADFASDDALEDAPLPVLAGAQGGEGSIAKYDPLQAYMREVQAHPLLSKAEEHELAIRYVKTGDVSAAARLVTANLRLVVKIAYEYRRAYRNMMDLIQEGNIGLMQAVKRYDPYRGVKLSSYAAWWIRAYMLRYMLNNWRMVKLGTTQAQRKLFFNLNKEKARLSAMGIEPTPGEIAQRLNVDEKEVVEMDRRLSRGDASLDLPVGDGDSSVSRVELLSSGSAGPELDTESAQLNEILRDQLARFRTTLTGKDAIIFDKRMVAEEPLTLQELGDEFGVSRERVRQLESRIAGKLRTFLKDSLGDAFEVES